MAHTELFRRLLRTMRLARDCEAEGISTEEGLARRAEAEAEAGAERSRRDFLAGLGVLAATGAVGGVAAACAPTTNAGVEGVEGAEGADPAGHVQQGLYNGPPLDVGIVGAGLAGLVCADQLRANGIVATVYEANTRVGGRQFSMKGLSPGQTIELGGELIDTSQKNMINYARAFNLTLEDYNKSPGEIFYSVDGTRVPESTVVDKFRAFVGAIQDDLRQVSSAPTADVHNAYDVAVDNTSIAAYLRSRNADPLLAAIIAAAYVGEYGREIEEQSALNFILYMRADRRSNFQPFGTSDQRYHIVEGNDGVAHGLASRLQGHVQLGMALASARKSAAGKIELTFANGVVRTHDYVVLAIPFTVLRKLTLDASLGLPAWKRLAIDQLGYGTNAKNMVAFAGRPWAAMGNNGMAYSTLPNLQNSWETSWTTATPTSAVITNFTGGKLGASQDPAKLQAQTAAFIADFDTVYPGAAAYAKKDASGAYVAKMMAWPQNPWSQGSYTCYRPGQFTAIAGNEGKPVGKLYFAGEHCDSFYDQQGFMEGALASGIATAAAIMTSAQKGA